MARGTFSAASPDRTLRVGRSGPARISTTVPNGGRFDGALGVVVGLEAVAALRHSDLRATLVVVAFRYEEGWRFGGGCFGSRAVCGLLPAGELETRDADGISVREALSELGMAGPEASSVLPGSFVEIHIEQGPVLEARDVPHAVVTAIAGIAGYSITFAERRSCRHAAPPGPPGCLSRGRGVRPRPPSNGPDGAGRRGHRRRRPDPRGARNVVPGLTTVSVDVRAPTSEALQRLVEAVPRLAEDAAGRNGCSANVVLRWLTEPVPMSDRVRVALHQAAADLGVPAIDLHSGAGHDAGIFAAHGVPTGMLFVRSLNGGASHRPDELTAASDIGTAISILTATLARLGRAEHSGPESRVISPSASA
jgi:hypothetical protein